jgi:hypothetical protein
LCLLRGPTPPSCGRAPARKPRWSCCRRYCHCCREPSGPHLRRCGGRTEEIRGEKGLRGGDDRALGRRRGGAGRHLHHGEASVRPEGSPDQQPRDAYDQRGGRQKGMADSTQAGEGELARAPCPTAGARRMPSLSSSRSPHASGAATSPYVAAPASPGIGHLRARSRCTAALPCAAASTVLSQRRCIVLPRRRAPCTNVAPPVASLSDGEVARERSSLLTPGRSALGSTLPSECAATPPEQLAGESAAAVRELAQGSRRRSSRELTAGERHCRRAGPGRSPPLSPDSVPPGCSVAGGSGGNREIGDQERGPAARRWIRQGLLARSMSSLVR